MEPNFVTIAIHTPERAQVLKTLLEQDGIEVQLHPVNESTTEITPGVRVRIPENELSHALLIVEEMEYAQHQGENILNKKNQKEILIPVDFSDYSIRTCDLGVKMAASMKARVVLLHSYYSMNFSMMQLTETLSYDIYENETIKELVRKAEEDMHNLFNLLKRKMTQGELPKVPITTEIREGIPEDVILTYAKEHDPILIIMGTRGKDQKESDLIGSVTAEIIDRSRHPVLAVPENVPLAAFEEELNVAFVNSIDEKDLLAFEKMMQLLTTFKKKIFFTQILPRKENPGNEKLIARLHDYIKHHYPLFKTEYGTIKEADLLAELESYIHEQRIGLMVINSHKRNIFTHLFNPSIAHKMIFHSDTPLLVFHS
ncbi:universal stress protein [Microbacter margulisiae]|uniref:Nucleotide-binding universal stress UspA family protein n=1 Tax=Microbacter margulisiae TaxID=1350067 RepID=A0A7W5H2A2_9PORP|nr:universal stress protein [Microbacter margulisiae]MBB3187550.1 nucleotide-binding universal stress UspA family protein [Microbacter margulisiae]